MQKGKQKMLLLGGGTAQKNSQTYARSENYHVIVCEEGNNSSETSFADEVYQINCNDQQAVLLLARKLEIDGIMACNTNAEVAAAFVAEKMGLPGNPYKSIKSLSERDLYRSFLRMHDFNVPWHGAFNNLKDFADASIDFQYPVLVKPVDANGSQGISAVNNLWEMDKAIDYAMKFSHTKRFIVEEYINKRYPQVVGEMFVYNGKIVSEIYGDQQNDLDSNPFLPTSINYPSLLPDSLLRRIQSELQRLIRLLKLNFGSFNFEVILDDNEAIFLIGFGVGNANPYIPNLLKKFGHIDTLKMKLDACMNQKPEDLPMVPNAGLYTAYMIHSNSAGRLKSVKLDERISKYVLEINLMLDIGEEITSCNAANGTVGIGLLEFPDMELRSRFMNRIDEFIEVEIE